MGFVAIINGDNANALAGQPASYYVNTATDQVIGGNKQFTGAVIVGPSDPGGSALLRINGNLMLTPGSAGRIAMGDVLLMEGTGASDAATISYISFRRSGGEKGWIGFGDGASGLMRFNNQIGNIQIATSSAIILGPSDIGGTERARLDGDFKLTGYINWDTGATTGLRLGPASFPTYVRYNTNGNLDIIPRASYSVVISGPTVINDATASLFIDRTAGGNASIIRLRDLTNNKYNWLFGSQFNADNGLEITASSSPGGSTYNQRFLTCVYDGAKKIGVFGATPIAQSSFTAATGTATRTAFDTATVTLPQLAERVKALIDDWRNFGWAA